jgi:hypothetical protein
VIQGSLLIEFVRPLIPSGRGLLAIATIASLSKRTQLLLRLACGRGAHAARRVAGKDVLIHLALIGASLDGHPAGEFAYPLGFIRAGLPHAAGLCFV